MHWHRLNESHQNITYSFSFLKLVYGNLNNTISDLLFLEENYWAFLSNTVFLLRIGTKQTTATVQHCISPA